MNSVYTSDFALSVLQILEEYSGKSLSLMISGGSILDYFPLSNIYRLETSGWTIYYSDERFGSDDLNYKCSIPFLRSTSARCIPIDTRLDPETSSNLYSKICKKVDLAILGVGEDGHIASIFPNSDILNSEEYFVRICNSPKEPPVRVTATIKFLNECVERLVFMIPPKGSKLKNVIKPHESILSRLIGKYTIYIDKRKISGKQS